MLNSTSRNPKCCKQVHLSTLTRPVPHRLPIAKAESTKLKRMIALRPTSFGIVLLFVFSIFISHFVFQARCCSPSFRYLTAITRFAHRVFDDSATFASTGRSSSVLLAEVWSRSLQEQLHELYIGPSRSAVPVQPIAAKAQETAKLNKDSTCSIAW